MVKLVEKSDQGMGNQYLVSEGAIDVLVSLLGVKDRRQYHYNIIKRNRRTGKDK